MILVFSCLTKKMQYLKVYFSYYDLMTMNNVLSHHSTTDTLKMIQGILFSNVCLNFLGGEGCGDGNGSVGFGGCGDGGSYIILIFNIDFYHVTKKRPRVSTSNVMIHLFFYN